jgi:hypothetical protein
MLIKSLQRKKGISKRRETDRKNLWSGVPD